jgi:hypothetical protein
MGLVAGSLPNLVSGVSQQPPTIRLSSSCEEMINAWPSVVAGLQKRPPTEHVASLGITVNRNGIGYLIDRDNQYRYIVVISDGSLNVYDFEGNAQTVDFPDGVSYLTQSLNPIEDFRFITLGDTTFILNKSVTVTSNEVGEIGTLSYVPTGTVATVDDLPGSPSVGDVYLVTSIAEYYRWENTDAKAAVNGWVAQGNWTKTLPTGIVVDELPETVVLGATYVLVKEEPIRRFGIGLQTGGTYYRQFMGEEIKPAVAAGQAWVERRAYELAGIANERLDPSTRATVHVTESFANINYSIYIDGALEATFLTSVGVDAATSVQGTDVIATELTNDLLTAGFNATRYGSTISIQGLPVGTKVQTTSGLQGDASLKCYTDSVKSFSDLPPNEVEGRIVRVQGDPDEQGDDYYVVYSDGLWVETNAYGSSNELRADTMPHVLVRNSDGTWTFKRHEWRGRAAGDVDSNPNPSFVGKKLSDVFLFTNRMGFLSDENIILSEADNFENFYRTTLAQLLDSDPVDFAIMNSGVDYLRHAIPFNKDLLLMSDRAQYRFKYNNFIGPKNVEVQFTTSFNVSPVVKPVNMGGSVYFLDDRPEYAYSKVFEYFPRDDQSQDDAEDATGAVPQYIPSNVNFIAGSPRTKLMVVFSANTPDTLYCYKFYWAGDKKVQNSWGKWTFEDCERIYWAGFSGNYLYMLVQRSDGVHLERIRIDEEAKVDDFVQRIFLDRQTSDLTLSYSVDDRETTITLPWSTDGEIEVISSGEMPDDDPITNFRHVVTKLADNQVKVDGDITEHEIIVGIPYEFSYEFSQQHVRVAKNGGEVVVLDGRLQMRYITVQFHDTAYFKAVLDTPGRDTFEWIYDGKVVGDPQALLGNTYPGEGKVNLPVMGKNTDIRLRLTNDSPFASAFGSAEWKAIYSPKAPQRV